MVKRTLAVLVIFLCLTVPVSTFDRVAYQRWVKETPGNVHLHGPGFFIDWELKAEDWGQQFCNIPASRNHRHFLDPPFLGGAYPNCINLAESENFFAIKCVHNQAITYIVVALSLWGVEAVWRQEELAF